MTFERDPRWEPAWRPRYDGVVFALTAVFVALAGAVVGLIWSAMAPKFPLPAILSGSEPAFRTLVGADAWFLLLTAIAGVVTGLLALMLAGRGPGVAAGLAVGGALAALVTDRVGWVAQHDGFLRGLHRIGLGPSQIDANVIDFHVRASGVLVAWPVAALVVFLLAVLLSDPADD